MKNPAYLLLLFLSPLVLNSCSKESAPPACPEVPSLSMKINGEEKEFVVQGRGIEPNADGTGHILHLILVNGKYYPTQDTHTLSIKLPYKEIGNNIFTEFDYHRAAGGSSAVASFIPGNLQNSVHTNTNTCVSMTFSGSATMDGSELVISEGIVDHVYENPF